MVDPVTQEPWTCQEDMQVPRESVECWLQTGRGWDLSFLGLCLMLRRAVAWWFVMMPSVALLSAPGR